MTRRFSRRTLAYAVCLVACTIAAAPTDVFAQKKFLIFGSSKIKYKPYRDASGRFEIDQPEKDWGLLPPAGTALALFSRTDRTATLEIDSARLTEPLAEGEITTNAQIEIDSLKEQQPNAKDFTSEVFESKGGKGGLIKYSRIGPKGAERVYRYLIGVERDLYRLDGVVQDAAAEKFEPILLHMMQSFKAPAGPAATKN